MLTIILLVVIVLLLIANFFRKPVTRLDTSRFEERLIRVESALDKLTPQIETEFRENRKEISENLQTVGRTLDSRVRLLQDDNNKKLEEMRLTVDEKLQQSVEKRFNDSFKLISNQLTQVYQGLGEMKNLAHGVGDLKKVMEGVKTRGIYGEVQLGNLISDCLSPNQYSENVITKSGSNDRVEFAIKMPGKGENIVHLPIDSKFPVENYARLIHAYDAASRTEIDQFRKALASDVKEQAKKISSKYLDPPATTDFGIMFVPTESLYAEILRIPGLSDEIRQKFNVVLASPSTLPVILSGLTMGFRSVAIEKRSAEVWQTLGAVKAQFTKFGDLLAATRKKLEETTNKIGAAEVTSRQIERKLRNVEALPAATSDQALLEELWYNTFMEKLTLWFLIFMAYAFGGWLVEVCIGLLQHRKLVNRGFLVGPICPIYGVGALLLSLILNPSESPLVIFCVAVVGSAILEYGVSYIMEKLFRVRWWDYTDRPFNLNGRICLESILSFGIFGILILKIINPTLITLFSTISPTVTTLLAASLFVWLLLDITFSLWLMFGVRITVGTVQRDATDEIAARVHEILSGKSKLNRRLVKAFPNQTPAKQSTRKKTKN